MRLIKVSVRNYRMHRELTLELDPRRTLIGGANESGKSTLIEAIHRALFLRARTGGETQQSMVSAVHGGHPEVDLEFEQAGRRFTLLKRFSGPGGRATLTELGGQSWHGDDAETRLAELLGVKPVSGGRGAGERAAQQWAHLWTWQGVAGDDPTRHANEQRDSLLARLQGAGGGAAMQSDFDAAVARAFAERHERNFTRSGDPKAGSEFAQAEAGTAAEEEAVAAAREALMRLERAAADFREAGRHIAEAGEAIDLLRTQQTDAEEKLARVETLKAGEKMQSLAASEARAKCDALAAAESRIAELRGDLEKARAALAPMETEQQRMAENESESRRRDAAAEAAMQRAAGAVRGVRLRSEAIRAHLGRLERRQIHARLQQTMSVVREARGALSKLEDALAKMPAISDAKIKVLHKLERDSSNAQAGLDAMAAGIEVVAASAVVKLGGRTLAAGDVEILAEETDLHVGDGVHLRIRPGGGTALADARERVRELSAQLARELDGCGFASVPEAAEAARRRRQAEAEAASAKARIETLDATGVERDFENATSALAQAEAEAERRSSAVPDAAPLPAKPEAVRALHASVAAELDAAVRSEDEARRVRTEAAAAWKCGGEAIAAHRAESGKQKVKASDLDAQIRLMLETHGGDEARARALGGLRAAREQADALLSQTRERLRELQPELLEEDLARIRRALDQRQQTREEAGQRRAVARSELQRDGAVDPQESLAMAEARLASARQRMSRARLHAGALRLLHRLFRDGQRALAEQFTQPLMDRIGSYLECIYGPGAHAAVDFLESSEFGGLRLIRPANAATGAFDFATLSGGTREQLAAAVRLAMAEVLAEAHGGCLPVVFDDAFACSDPERVQTLQRMLDHAANRGLQIIVLTCTPADYAALGALSLTLRA